MFTFIRFSGPELWGCILFCGSKTKVKGKAMEKLNKRMTQTTIETGSDLSFAEDFSFLAVQGNCGHKPTRNTETIRGPQLYQALPKVTKHQSLTIIGRHKTYMGCITNSEKNREWQDPTASADLMNPNTDNYICSLREWSSRAHEFITDDHKKDCHLLCCLLTLWQSAV